MFIIYYIANYFAATEVGYSKVRDRFGGMGRFTGGLKCKGWVSSITINVITESNMQVFKKI